MTIVETLRARHTLLNAREVCDILGVHRETLYVWIAEDRFPSSLRVGRAHKFEPATVAEWLEARLT